MKRFGVSAVLSVLATVALFTGVAQADQVMLNPSIEQGTDAASVVWKAIDWKGSAGTVVTDSALAHTGSKFWKADGLGSQPGIWQVAKLNPAAGTCTAEAWFYVPTLTAPVTAELRCWFKKTNGVNYVGNPYVLSGTINSVGWTKVVGSFNYDPNSTTDLEDSLEIRVVAYTGGKEFYIDDVTVNAPVTPEPGSLAGLAMGATGLVGFAIRRRKTA